VVMTKLQSTGVFGLVAAPIEPTSSAGYLCDKRGGLLHEEEARPSAGAIVLQAMRVVAAASIVCCLVLSATVAVAVAASFVGAYSPFQSVPTR
jgi:hypothetical protein